MKPTTVTFLVALVSLAIADSGKKVIVNRETGRCLDSDWGKDVQGQKLGGKVYTLPCNGGNYQNWYQNGNQIKNAETGWCLDYDLEMNLRPVFTLKCNNGPHQTWKYSSPFLYTGPDNAIVYLDSNYKGFVYPKEGNGGKFQQWDIKPAEQALPTAATAGTAATASTAATAATVGTAATAATVGTAATAATGQPLEPPLTYPSVTK